MFSLSHSHSLTLSLSLPPSVCVCVFLCFVFVVLGSQHKTLQELHPAAFIFLRWISYVANISLELSVILLHCLLLSGIPDRCHSVQFGTVFFSILLNIVTRGHMLYILLSQPGTQESFYVKLILVAGNYNPNAWRLRRDLPLNSSLSGLYTEFQASLSCRVRPCSNLVPSNTVPKGEKIKLKLRDHWLYKSDMQHLCKAKVGKFRIENESSLEL